MAAVVRYPPLFSEPRREAASWLVCATGLAGTPAFAELVGCTWTRAATLPLAFAAIALPSLGRLPIVRGVLGLAGLTFASALAHVLATVGTSVHEEERVLLTAAGLIGAAGFAAFVPLLLAARSMVRLTSCDAVDVAVVRSGVWLAGLAVVSMSAPWSSHGGAAGAGIAAAVLLGAALARDVGRFVVLARISRGRSARWAVEPTSNAMLPALVGATADRTAPCVVQIAEATVLGYRRASQRPPIARWNPDWGSLVGRRIALELLALTGLAAAVVSLGRHP